MAEMVTNLDNGIDLCHNAGSQGVSPGFPKHDPLYRSKAMSENKSTIEIEYRPISGFPGYRVGSDGSVWSRWNRNGQMQEWRKRKLSPYRSGHLHLYLYRRDGSRKDLSVHRLVLIAFVGPPPTGKHGCAHANGIPHDNRLPNLRWATLVDNFADKRVYGSQTYGETHPRVKLTWEKVREIRRRHCCGESHASLARAFHVGTSQIYRIVVYQSWIEGGRKP